MSLINKLLNPGPDVYYDPAFRIVFEDHLNFILNNNRTSIMVQTTDENTAARFAGDWRGLMLALSQVPHMAWFQMRINGYSSTSDYDGKQVNIHLLDIAVIEKLVGQFKTQKKK